MKKFILSIAALLIIASTSFAQVTIATALGAITKKAERLYYNEGWSEYKDVTPRPAKIEVYNFENPEYMDEVKITFKNENTSYTYEIERKQEKKLEDGHEVISMELSGYKIGNKRIHASELSVLYLTLHTHADSQGRIESAYYTLVEDNSCYLFRIEDIFVSGDRPSKSRGSSIIPASGINNRKI